MSAESEILELGLADWLPLQTAFTTHCGTRLYPQAVTEPNGPTFPLCVYRRLSTGGEGGRTLKAGSNQPLASLELRIYGGKGPDGYRLAKRAAYDIGRHLDGWKTYAPSTTWGQVWIENCKLADHADFLEAVEGTAPDQLAQGVNLVFNVSWRTEPIQGPRS